MKICVVSDSHGEDYKLEKILRDNKDCDYFIHCGDSHFDKKNPLLDKFVIVKGNHDTLPFPLYTTLDIDNHRILIAHGHYDNIYVRLDLIVERAKKMGADIVCHGHTHIPFCESYLGVLVICPGSTMFNRSATGFATYAILEINDGIDCKFIDFDTKIDVTDEAIKDGLKQLDFFRRYEETS